MGANIIKPPESLLLAHVRKVAMRPRAGRWAIECSCGWEGSVSLLAYRTRRQIERALDDEFRKHLPEGERRLYLLVDQRPGHEATWIMPEGSPTQLLGYSDDDGTFIGRISAGGYLPVGEVRTANGQIFKIE